MKEFKVNPLNINKRRRLDCLLPYMAPVPFSGGQIFYKHDSIEWIEKNLKGRYWIGSVTKLNDNKLQVEESIAFEDPHELTMFILGCPHYAKSKGIR